MTEPEIKHTILENGLTVVEINLPNFHSITNFLAIRSGSRYEDKNNNGVAHFLEHMVFKGTQKYSDTAAIARAIEGVGGNFNAWTSVDHTAYYNTVPTRQWQVGMEVPFELAFRPLLRAEDLDRERGVIIEEIRMIQDDPARWVHDISEQILFDGHPLGQSVIGNEKTISKMSLDDFGNYHKSHYNPSQAVLIVVGNLQGLSIVDEAKKLSEKLVAKPKSVIEKFVGASKKNIKIINKKTDQTHFVLASADASLALPADTTYTAEVLSTVLGRGMSSRLFLHVREQKGLAYSIHADVSNMEDTGAISIYGGINTPKMERALEAVAIEMKNMQEELVGQQELEKAKAMLVGHYDIIGDKSSELARWYGLGMLLHKKETLQEAKERIGQVTAEQIRDLAKIVFAKNKLTLAVVGPYKDDSMFQAFLAD